MSMQNLRQLLLVQLEELLASERHAHESLPRLAGAAGDAGLVQSLHDRADSAREHAVRLGVILERLSPGSTSRPPRSKPESRASQGLIQDCMSVASDLASERHVRDAAIIAVVQHFLHHEIAGYGCGRAWASILGDERTARDLARSLEEEKQADLALSRLAERLNREAASVVMSA